MVVIGVASFLFNLRNMDDVDVKRTALVGFFLICENQPALQLFCSAQPQ